MLAKTCYLYFLIACVHDERLKLLDVQKLPRNLPSAAATEGKPGRRAGRLGAWRLRMLEDVEDRGIAGGL